MTFSDHFFLFINPVSHVLNGITSFVKAPGRVRLLKVCVSLEVQLVIVDHVNQFPKFG